MTNEEWAASDSAPDMLKTLYLKDPAFFKTRGNDLHRYLIACCWQMKHLIPQKGLRAGLKGVSDWIDGRITADEFWRLDWYAEADCFMLDYAKTPEDFKEIRAMIANIEELKTMTFDKAKDTLKDAAYFTNRVMVHPTTRSSPFLSKFFSSPFLCPALLREMIQVNFDD